jgi:6-phosphofructokinase 1
MARRAAVIGVLTAGGDCPGLNACIRGVVGRATRTHGVEVVGIRDGWEGLMHGRTQPLTRDSVRGVIGRGGTFLGTSRLDPYVHGNGYASIRETIEANGIEALVVIGGDGTLRSALRLAEEGLPVVGVPKTIDNDISATDVTFGFDTAVQIATEAIDRIATTAESHNRVMLVEVMGRTKGWIATYAGIAAGADAILVPEETVDLDDVCRLLRTRHRHGHSYSIVVVGEGVHLPESLGGGGPAIQGIDAFGFERLGGVAYRLAPLIEERTGFETRVTVLGHLQRGGTPSALDRVLATRFGTTAADYAVEGRSGIMVALHGTQMTAVPLADACAEIRGVDPQLFDVARTFFG